MRAYWILLVCAVCASAQFDYDLLLQGGHLIDPKNAINGARDVAVAGGRIAAVAEDIPASSARRVVDVSSLYVTPGLIDMHVHSSPPTGTPCVVGDSSVHPDGFSFRSGVTTVVDAGSAGADTFADFKARVIDCARTRVLAFLNIARVGMVGAPEQNPANMDPRAAATAARRYPELIVGIKTAHYPYPDWTAVERAVEAGRLASLPVMVDFGTNYPQRPLEDLVLVKLRPGDIYTHLHSGQRNEQTANGRVNTALWQARERGVFMDTGHGRSSFLWRIAVPATQEGFLPDSISTDLHAGCMNAGMKDMLNVVSKYLAMQVPLEEVILRSTWLPAQVIRRQDLGHLSVGAPADLAVLRMENGDFGFVDASGLRLKGRRRLVAELTLRGGTPVWDLNGITAEDWDKPRL